MIDKDSNEFRFYYDSIEKKRLKIKSLQVLIGDCIPSDIVSYQEQIAFLENSIGLIYDEIKIKEKYIKQNNYFIHSKSTS